MRTLLEIIYYNLVKKNMNEYVVKEIEGLKLKQTQVTASIAQAQKELQRLHDTNLVISGALQALNHLIEYQETASNAKKQEAKTLTTDVSSTGPVFQQVTRARDQGLNVTAVDDLRFPAA